MALNHMCVRENGKRRVEPGLLLVRSMYINRWKSFFSPLLRNGKKDEMYEFSSPQCDKYMQVCKAQKRKK